MSINIPEELYDQARGIADAYHISVEQVFTSAFSEHLSAWRQLRDRAARGDREKFLAVLNRVPDVEPEQFDAL